MRTLFYLFWHLLCIYRVCHNQKIIRRLIDGHLGGLPYFLGQLNQKYISVFSCLIEKLLLKVSPNVHHHVWIICKSSYIPACSTDDYLGGNTTWSYTNKINKYSSTVWTAVCKQCMHDLGSHFHKLLQVLSLLQRPQGHSHHV